jgi:predicted DNA-binding antitoxin AbrB/MazE fold protein
MSTVVEAVYQNGMLKLAQPLSLPEGMRVRVTITPADEDYDPLEGVIGICKDGPVDGAENHDKYIYGDLRR